MTSVWDNISELSDTELRQLSEAAISVLWDPEPGTPPPTQMPPKVLASELSSVLDDTALVASLTADDHLSHEATVITLRGVAGEPAVAAEIEAAYRARQGLMIVDGGVLLGAALVLAVFKLKRLKVGKDGFEVSFYEAKADVLAALRKLTGG